MDFERDFYSDLGVLPDVSKEVIRAVYLALAKRFHPDGGGNDHADQEKFKIINRAYEILYDENARSKYDEGRAEHQQSSYNRDVDEEDLFDDELADDWKFAVEYYPDLEKLRKEVSKISSTLSVVFQSTLLSKKNFGDAVEIKAEIIDRFVGRYFGKDTNVKEFALKLLKRGRRDAAKELNRAVLVFGDSLNSDEVIRKIVKKFGLGNVDAYANFPRVTGTSHFVLRHGDYAIYGTKDSRYILVDKTLNRDTSAPIFQSLKDARKYLMERSRWW